MVEVTFEEHQADLAKELETIGLLEAVMKRLSEINVTTMDMGYIQHRTVQALLCDIEDLILLNEGGNSDET